MLTRKINSSILLASNTTSFLMKMGIAVLLAKLVWWIFTPAYNEVYVERARVNQKDSSIKYIINRYPFGEVVLVKPKDMTPEFSSLVKLHGVYVSGGDSMAFITYNNKSVAVKVAGEISSNIVLTKVTPDSIIITQNGVDATIKMSKATSVTNNSMLDRGGSNRMPSSYQNNNSDNNSDNLMERRKELIEKFAKQELNNDADNSRR